MDKKQLEKKYRARIIDAEKIIKRNQTCRDAAKAQGDDLREYTLASSIWQMNTKIKIYREILKDLRAL